MTRDDLKLAICGAIDRRAEEITRLGETVRKHPELGFKEMQTARVVEEQFRALGLPTRGGLALTGVRADLAGAKTGPTLALLGELDALIVEGHPLADPETGAAHACGHNCQVAALVGAAMGLVDVKAASALAGRIAFFAVPAEEHGDIEWRLGQTREGKLEFLCGKPELLRLKELDDVDLAMMFHTNSGPSGKKAGVATSYNGCVVKSIRYRGRAAHAGAAPHEGINALYAATIGLMAINAVRETFPEADTIRVHPIITHGGSQVNVIPAETRVETYVRGRSVEAIVEASRKVDRALRAGALALGARVEIETRPGYLPLRNHEGLAELFRANAVALVGEDFYATWGPQNPSTDMGDLSHLMPILHPEMGGARGGHHTAEFEIVDPDLAYVTPAKALAMTAVDLLWDDAAEARKILKSWKPQMTREEYLAFQRRMTSVEVFDGGAECTEGRPAAQ